MKFVVYRANQKHNTAVLVLDVTSAHSIIRAIGKYPFAAIPYVRAATLVSGSP